MVHLEGGGLLITKEGGREKDKGKGGREGGLNRSKGGREGFDDEFSFLGQRLHLRTVVPDLNAVTKYELKGASNAGQIISRLFPSPLLCRAVKARHRENKNQPI